MKEELRYELVRIFLTDQRAGGQEAATEYINLTVGNGDTVRLRRADLLKEVEQCPLTKLEHSLKFHQEQVAIIKACLRIKRGEKL